MISKKAYRNINILMSIIISISLPLTVLAEELDSTNFKIVGATTQGGGIVESTSGNYSTLLGVGSISSDPRIYSTSYKLGTSPETPFLPAVPTISCFETTTDGYSACSTGPTELSTGGMTALCGPGGCYDRARFEISTEPYRFNTDDSGLVSYWPMDELGNDSCVGGEDMCDVKGENEGVATGSNIVDGKHNKARSFNGSTDFIQVDNDPSLQITGDQTISLWLYPNNFSSRKNPYDKAYGGEGTITQETNGSLNYYYGTYGGNSSPYQGVGTSIGALTLNTWNHVVLVRNLTTMQITWYINGSQNTSTTASYASATASTNPVRIGIGYAGYYDGKIDEVMLFNRALSLSEVQALYTATAPVTNPPDTLYAIMISTDNFVSDIRYIDASTFTPEAYSTHNINDFMTKTDWEIETFNVQGLEAGKTYYLKAFALKGDFTQTETGPIKSATTATGTLFFDIDIANSTGYTTETSPPYSISFTGAYELIGGSAAITAGNRIWMDTETNSQGGFAIIGNGLNGGLYSSTTSQTITSATANLDQVNSGFGLQSEYIDYDTSSPLLGAISVTSDYSGSINSVGAISTTPKKIYDGNGPIVGGRMALKVIAKPGTSYTPASNYQESITLIFVPRY